MKNPKAQEAARLFAAIKIQELRMEKMNADLGKLVGGMTKEEFSEYAKATVGPPPAVTVDGAYGEPLIDKYQAALILDCCPAQVYFLAVNGNLPHTWVGHLIRFQPEAIRAWAANGGYRGPAKPEMAEYQKNRRSKKKLAEGVAGSVPPSEQEISHSPDQGV